MGQSEPEPQAVDSARIRIDDRGSELCQKPETEPRSSFYPRPMTLILAFANQDQAVLVSDRRLTVNGRLQEEESNKAGVLFLGDARLVFAFTGLATAGRFQTRLWLATALMRSADPDFSMRGTINRFAERATADIAGLGMPSEHRRLSVIFVGYHYGETPPRAWCWLVSNWDTLDGSEKEPAGSWEGFKVTWIRDKRPREERLALFVSTGADRALLTSEAEAFMALVREGKLAAAVVGKAVEVLRAVADRPESRGLIGKQCTSIILPSDTGQPAAGDYHTMTVSNTTYTPTVINAVGGAAGVFTLTDGEIEQRPGPTAVPKVGRNQPCPCGSGKKYKRCHGS